MPTLGSASFIDEFGINWGTAAEDLADWTGPKGAIKKGQLLVGAINTLEVTVTPKNADLTQAKLTLVDMNGKAAPATVTPSVKEVENDDMLTGSRAASVDGVWTLNVATTATAEEMATAYAGTDEAGAANNLKYALAVDGVVMTGYDFVIDTWTADEVKENDAAPAFDKSENTSSVNTKLFIGDRVVATTTTGDVADYAVPVKTPIALGENKITYKDASVYDVQVDIAPESIDDAELLGITLDKTTNTLNVSDKAAANSDKKIKLNVTLLGVNGKKSDKITVRLAAFASTSVEDKQTIATTEYTLTPSTDKFAKNIIVDMEDVFTSLTAEQSTDLVASNGVLWSDGGKLFASSYLTGNGQQTGFDNVTYYASLEDAKAMKNPIKVDDNTTGSRVRSIKYAVIAIADANYTNAFKAEAEEGKYDVEITLRTSKGEIKKVVAPINVKLPAFDSVFTKVDDGLWTAEGRSMRLTGDGSKSLSFSGLYTNKYITASSLSVDNVKYTDENGDEADLLNNTSQTVDNNVSTSALIVTNAIVDKSLDVTMSYTFVGKLKISTSFTANVKSQFEGASLVYYSAKNTPAAKAVINGNGIIVGGLGANGAGLELQFNADKKAMVASTKDSDQKGLLGSQTDREKISGLLLLAGTTSASTTVGYTISFKECAVQNLSATPVDGGLQIANYSALSAGQGGIMVVTFTDNDGVKTTAEIEFVRE